jgi:DNA-binding CsgD family transcriptional regulator/lambda repressor-like predicted transcriptional regulator
MPARPVAAQSAPAAEVVRLYGLGLTMAEIAGIFGVSAWTVASRLDGAGVARRRRASGSQARLPVDEAVRRYRRQPHRLGELAAELNISALLITGRAQRPGRVKHGRRRADVPAGQVADLYQAGWTVSQIAARYQVAASTVLRRLDEAGVARRPTSALAVFAVDEAARRVQQDRASFAELAREYQVSVDVVRAQLRARGIAPPPRTGPRVLRGIPAAQLAGEYASGLTVAQIAARYGVSRATISTRLHAAGLAGPRPARPVPAGEAAALYRQGASLKTLAGRYAVSAMAIRRHLASAGAEVRPPGGQRAPIPVPEAARLYAEGQTVRQLARRYQVSEQVIRDRLAEAGTPLRRTTDPKPVDPALLARLARQVGLEAVP